MWRPPNVKPVKFYFLDSLGWPVETVKGRPIQNLLRLIIHTRKITTKRPLCLSMFEYHPHVPITTSFEDAISKWEKSISIYPLYGVKGSRIQHNMLLGNIDSGDDESPVKYTVTFSYDHWEKVN